MRPDDGQHPPAGAVGLVLGASEAGRPRRGRGLGGLRGGEPVGGVAAGAGTGEALGDDQPSAGFEDPVQFGRPASVSAQ